jgi:phosphoglycerol transferase MdoB-like AlkP superfamily enzyme
MVGVFFIGRLALFILYFDKLQNTDSSYWFTFLYGLRIDTISASIFLIIPLLLLTLSPKILQKMVNIFLKYYFLVVIAFLIYIEIATFPFIAQYDVRPNYLFVEYLQYPKEVFGMIFAEYKMALSFAFVLIAGFVFVYLRHFKENLQGVFQLNWFKRILWLLPLFIILSLGIRSSLGHRPANTSDAMYSSNRMLNEITKNSIHSVAYAVYVNARHDSNGVGQYGDMGFKEAISRVKKRLNIQSLNENFPLRRKEYTHFKHKKSKNLVIFLQESLGYQFVEAVGGEKGITPNLNQLSKEGILFKDLYSNGTRSIRGIAGIVAGGFAVPGKGVVKRNKSQNDYFTIAKLLKPYGYHASFIYGGESRFDNMKSWFLGNGFDEIIDQSRFKNPKFTGTWGVSDEEVVNRAHQEYKKLYQNNQKFVSVIFSTSNHSPFDFPKGKISLIKGVAEKSVKNAIKYADFAIGRLIAQARSEDYYKDTVFLVVADHNVRVYGDDMIPVDMFQIPALILGAHIKPMVHNQLATQPDVLATALDLIGLDLTYPIMGYSIFSSKKQNISLMQFNTYYALRVDDTVAILRPNKAPITFIYKNKHLSKIKHNETLEKDALAFIVVLDYLYNNKQYQ